MRLYFRHFLSALFLAVSVPLVLADEFSSSYDKYNAATFGKRPIQTFVSNPALTAPLLQVNTWEPSKISPTGGSHIFLRHDYELSSPLILDASDLSVVYVNRSYDRTSDVRPQRIGNQTFLTFFSGSIVDGHGLGDGLVLNGGYEEEYRVKVAGLKTRNDLHEFQMTKDGTALVTAYDEVRMDLKPYRGSSRGRILDGMFQEIDVVTGEVLFQWRASEHVDLADSFYKMEPKWDFFHINSVQKTQDGNYLISARHMHSLYLISGTTGAILWTLGGKKNQFTELAPLANPSGDALLSFAWQHHARFVPNTAESELTFFDNHALTTAQHCTKDCSRGLHIRLDASNLTVQILTEFRHPESLQAQSQGSVQPLDDGSGNVFVGWGRCPSFTEHTADGEAVMDVQFSPWHTALNEIALDNYRAYRGDWHATPAWDPDVMARKEEDGEVRVYASWNGATEVKYWAFLASNESSDLFGPDSVVAIVPRDGFETSFVLDPEARFARAVALGADHEILRSSGTVDVENQTVFADVAPVAAVIQDTIVDDGENGYALSITRPEFFDQAEDLLGVSFGWHTALGCALLFMLMGAWFV